MADNHIAFYTKTMAKVYADQGHWDKAAEIYRHLLKQEPERQDLVDALRETEKIIGDLREKNQETLTVLFAEWIELLLDQDKIRKLKTLRSLMKKTSEGGGDS